MVKRRRRAKTPTSTTKTNKCATRARDPVTAYAKAVDDGKVVAGPHVHAACARHLRDRKEGPKRGLKWDKAAVTRVIGFFRDKLCVDRVAGDGPIGSAGAVKPFDLLPFQAFIVGSLFGWKLADGTRRFRLAFIEAGKGTGKSPLAAGVGLYMLTADKEHRAEVYSAATKKDQAKVLFRDAVAMVERSPDLLDRLLLSGGVEKHNIAYLTKGSFFRPISTEDRGKGQSGPRPHCGLLDEIHEHPTNLMVEMMRAGVKSRRQALIFMITNSGVDRESVCYDYHDYGVKVCAGEIEDDSFFAFICALDEGDDPFKDEACWPKANPELGAIITPQYLRDQVKQARGMPSKENLVRRLNFCQWTDAIAAWVARDVWVKCERKGLALSTERPCYGGLDLSGKKDLTALALASIPDENGVIEATVEFWTPAASLMERTEADRAPYDVWRRDGHLVAVPGKTINYGYVANRLAEVEAEHELVQLGYDRWRIDDLLQALEDAGVEAWKISDEKEGMGLCLVEHGQGFKDMSLAVEAIEDLILNDRLRVKYNPVLRWNVASTVLDEDPAGNRKFTKRRSTGRIDGVVALAMAVRLAVAGAVVEPSIYEAEGYVV